MNKQTKYIILVVAVIALGVLIYLIATTTTKNGATSKVGGENNDNVSTEDQGRPLIDGETPNATPSVDAPGLTTRPMPVYTKEIEVDFMSLEEKKAMGIPEVLKVQVLERDAEGTVLNYKIIRKDDDIMTKFGN
jgi:hypothetical protein